MISLISCHAGQQREVRHSFTCHPYTDHCIHSIFTCMYGNVSCSPLARRILSLWNQTSPCLGMGTLSTDEMVRVACDWQCCIVYVIVACARSEKQVWLVDVVWQRAGSRHIWAAADLHRRQPDKRLHHWCCHHVCGHGGEYIPLSAITLIQLLFLSLLWCLIIEPWLYVCIYVCPKIYIRRALSKKVTVAPWSQTNRNVFSARLNHSVGKSAERREDGRLFQILAPATAKLRSPNVLLVRRTTNIAVSDDRSVHRPESAMSWQCWRSSKRG